MLCFASSSVFLDKTKSTDIRRKYDIVSEEKGGQCHVSSLEVLSNFNFTHYNFAGPPKRYSSVNRIHMKEKKIQTFALNMLLFFEIYIFEKNMLLLCMGCC